MGVLAQFDRGATLFPNRTCLVEGDVAKTYAEVRQATFGIAACLAGSRIQRGDKVAMLSANSMRAFEFMFGVYRAGCIFVPLSAAAGAEELAHILNHTKTRVLGVDALHRQVADDLKRRCPLLTTVVVIDDLSLPPGEPGATSLPESLDEVVSIYSTGGTTGVPKCVEFTALTWDTMSANFHAALPCPDHPIYLVSTPMTHASGTISIPLFAIGATVVVTSEFRAGEALRLIERHKVTHLWLPPTAVYLLLDDPDLKRRDCGSLQCFMYSAAPMSVAKLRECLEVFGPVMVQIWGQTEAPCFCTCLDQQDHVEAMADGGKRLASCGRPMLFSPTAIMADDGRLCGANEIGELVVRGNLVTPGYHRDDATTRATIVDGWLHTGDVGYQDDRGFVFIVDRKKEMIISGGVNIYPAEVEQAVLAHPAVRECVVFGVPDEKWGEAVRAVVVLKTGASATDAEIRNLCRETLKIKSPKVVEFRESLPRTPVGKIDRNAVKKPYWVNCGRLI